MAGVAVVTLSEALLWTDGHYHLQASQQLDQNWTLMKQGEKKMIISYLCTVYLEIYAFIIWAIYYNYNGVNLCYIPFSGKLRGENIHKFRGFGTTCESLK